MKLQLFEEQLTLEAIRVKSGYHKINLRRREPIRFKKCSWCSLLTSCTAISQAFAVRIIRCKVKVLLHDAIFPATCNATLLRDKLQINLRV